MPKQEHVSLPVIRRLPRYYRFLGDLLKNSITRISSKELSARMGLTASQIRQDLNCFGGFGQQGYGYNIEHLYHQIGQILGVDEVLPTIIVGAGNLGRAMATQIDFEQRGFKLIGIFDVDQNIVGQTIQNIVVQNISELETFCKKNKPKIAIFSIPREAAPVMAHRLVELGITGFWNFTHYDIGIKYPHIPVENVHLSDSLMTLSYRVKDKTNHS